MSQAKPSVLIVDDIEANLVVLEAVLGGMSCELVRVRSGNEALKELLKREFAVMLLDVQMPGMDGYEVAQIAGDNPATRDVPIIFVTAVHSAEESMLRGYGTGAVDFLLKPINPHVLRAKVQVFLDLEIGRRRLDDEVEAHKQTLAELEVANEALRHFTSAASHDLREPLRAVQGFLQALVEDVGDRLGPEAQDYLLRSRKASGRMMALLDSLLSYSRLQRSKPHAEVDCAAVVEQVKTDLAIKIAEAQAQITVSDLPRVQGDAARVYELFLNLITNALKFRQSEQAPEIHVSAQARAGETVLSVEDNGIGIDPADLGAVFEAFRRLHGRGEFDGSGLGLTICKQIVDQHGGRIWVEPAVRRGSRFCFTLPGRRNDLAASALIDSVATVARRS
jgi:two-component system sensor histidine kinase/response regulator